MAETFDDDIRSGVRRLVDGAPDAPDWKRVKQTQLRRRRGRNLRWGALGVVAALLGVVLVGRQATDDQTVVAGPGEDAASIPCGVWIAVHTLFDSAVNTPDRNARLSITAEQAAFLAKFGDVPDRVAEAIGGDPADLAARVVAKSNPNLGTIEITVWADNPGEARQLADSFAEALLASVSDIQRREGDRERSVLETAIAQLELGTVTGDELSDIARKRLQLQELEQRLAAGSNIYSLGSSEAFQVASSQLTMLFSGVPPATRVDEGDC